MALQLKQVRPCDGECCKESPRWPNKDHSDCIYHDDKGCKIHRGEAEIPKGPCPVIPSLDGPQVFKKYCTDWPQKNCDTKLSETANCCWQWVNV